MGGRGPASGLPTVHPGGGGSGDSTPWSPGLGFRNYDTLKEALGSKGRPDSVENAVRKSNPHYDPTMSYREFTENCQRAVIAYEARRRGYDVTAQPTYNGDQLPRTAYVDRNGLRYSHWMGAFKNAQPVAVGASNVNLARTRLENEVKSWGNGARGIVQVVWKGTHSGHVFNIEVHNGRVMYVDAQVGARYDPRELYKAIDTSRTQVVRTDKLAFSERAKKSVTKDKW